jgi:TolB protein
MRPLPAFVAAAAALGFALDDREPLITLVQQDAVRSNSEAPSAAVSADGRHVAFTSYARLVPADTNNVRDIYVLDRTTGRVTLESVTTSDGAANHDSTHPGLSGDGRFLVYETHVERAGGALDARHVLLRDRRESTITMVSAGPPAAATVGWSGIPAISQNGEFVAFASTATHLVPGSDANGAALDVYLFDTANGTTRRISVDNRGNQRPSGYSTKPSLSADGRFVAFASAALLESVDGRVHATRRNRPLSQIYVRDTRANVTRLVSRGAAGRPTDGSSWAPVISGDGRYVAFVSAATNLADGDRNGADDVFISDLHSGATEIVSRSRNNGTGNGPSGGPAISSDGRFIAFHSEASDLVCAQRCATEHEDVNLLADVFLLDRQTGVIARVSADTARGWMECSSGAALDGGGTIVAFSSRHPVDPSDQRYDFDLFVRRIPTTLTASLR